MKSALIKTLLSIVLIAFLVPGLAKGETTDEQLCTNANTNNDAHGLDNHCPIAAAQQLDLSKSTSDPKEAQTAELREGGYLFLAAKGALLTMQFELGAAELAKAHAVFKDVRDNGVTKDLRVNAMEGLKMVDDTVSKLSHMGDQ